MGSPVSRGLRADPGSGVTSLSHLVSPLGLRSNPIEPTLLCGSRGGGGEVGQRALKLAEPLIPRDLQQVLPPMVHWGLDITHARQFPWQPSQGLEAGLGGRGSGLAQAAFCHLGDWAGRVLRSRLYVCGSPHQVKGHRSDKSQGLAGLSPSSVPWKSPPSRLPLPGCRAGPR